MKSNEVILAKYLPMKNGHMKRNELKARNQKIPADQTAEPLVKENANSRLVQMCLLPKTMDIIENLSKLTNNCNCTLLVDAAIQLTE